MNSILLSTNEVASMIRVTETTIKRWADEGKLPCIKSVGGHRKFKLNDIMAFADQYGYPLTGTQLSSMEGSQREQFEVAVFTRNYKKIADIIMQKSLQSDREGILDLLHYLYKNHIGLSSIADEIIRPALVLIGELWKEGKLDIEQEHRASEAVRESLIRFAPELHHKTPNGLTALCACPENEYHEIGLRSFAYVLENEGWHVIFLGANTPFQSLRSFISKAKPDVVCLSITVTERDDDFFEGMRSIGTVTRAYNGKYLVGSYHSGMFREKDLGCDCLTSSSVDAVAYLRDAFQLKPGPRKSTTTTVASA